MELSAGMVKGRSWKAAIKERQSGFTYGRGYGLLVSYFSALFSVAFGFTVTRCMNGGVTIEQLELPVPRGCERCCRCLNWTVERLKVAPIRSVACLRLVFFLSPQLNSGLAFTGVKFAPYMAGSALGIPAQLVLAVFLLDFLLGGDGTTGASPPPPPLG